MHDNPGHGRRLFSREVRTNGSSPARVDHQRAIWRQWLRQLTNSKRCHEECRGSVGISTRSDISTRHLRPDRKRSLRPLNCFFVSIPLIVIHYGSPQRLMPQKSKALAGWLNPCCWALKQLSDHSIQRAALSNHQPRCA